jgi:hypothetical protein
MFVDTLCRFIAMAAIFPLIFSCKWRQIGYKNVENRDVIASFATPNIDIDKNLSTTYTFRTKE